MIGSFERLANRVATAAGVRGGVDDADPGDVLGRAHDGRHRHELAVGILPEEHLTGVHEGLAATLEGLAMRFGKRSVDGKALHPREDRPEIGRARWTQGAGRPFPAQHINVDWKGNVWVSEEARGHAVVKFTREGKFLLQIGEVDKTNGSADTKLLGAPSGVDFDPTANEVYIADGYLNQRIIVFDADTGAYKRHWGRYGLKPDDT